MKTVWVIPITFVVCFAVTIVGAKALRGDFTTPSTATNDVQFVDEEQFVDGERIAHISHKSGLYVVHDYENGQICYYARSYQSVALDCHVADLHVEE